MAHGTAGWAFADQNIFWKFRSPKSLALYLHIFGSALKSMERVKGIEPSSQAWEARILPLNHTRKRLVNFISDAPPSWQQVISTISTILSLLLLLSGVHTPSKRSLLFGPYC